MRIQNTDNNIMYESSLLLFNQIIMYKKQKTPLIYFYIERIVVIYVLVPQEAGDEGVEARVDRLQQGIVRFVFGGGLLVHKQSREEVGQLIELQHGHPALRVGVDDERVHGLGFFRKLGEFRNRKRRADLALRRVSLNYMS